ncbi:MAG: CvpA family protein [Dehalococcoidia bacterium]|nr:CvpA family protein [Dehalococcoidia bacterium]HRC62761.1 CvpA family protein [Dehalococcoidia bacterium]
MHWIDLVILAVIAWTTFAAFRSGLIREVIPLASVILGAILASKFYDNLAADIDFIIDDEATRKFIAFVAIFVGIVVVGHIASVLLRTMATLLMLGPLDHVGGAVFGFLKGLLFVEILVFAATSFPVAGGVERAMNDSAFASFFVERLPLMKSLMPGEVKQALNTFKDGHRPGQGADR